MHGIPKIIHFTVPAEISEAQSKAIALARELNPEWTVRVWQDPLNPLEFELGNLWGYVNSGAQLADLIRLEVVYRDGGIYLDSDVILQRNLDSLLDFEFFAASEDGLSLTNAVFGAIKHSPVLRSLIDTLREDSNLDWELEPTLTTGPALFSRELRWNRSVTVLPRETFYPYNWNEKTASPHKLSFGTHTWAKSWSHVTAQPPNNPLEWMRSFARSMLATVRTQSMRRHNIERYVRFKAGFLRSYQASGELCVNTVHGYRILVSGTDVSVTPQIASYGYYELREEILLKRILRGGDWAVDVGANVGMFTLLMAQQVGSFGRVFAFEPNPVCIRLLTKSATMNWMHDRIEISQAAVGESNATATLSFNTDRLGDGTALEDREQGVFRDSALFTGNVQTLAVPLQKLDDQFSIDIPIRVLKIDAEGFEHKILRGATRLIKQRCFDYIMIEVLKDVARNNWMELCEALRELEHSGYLPQIVAANGRLVPTTVSAIIRSTAGTGRNFIFRSVDARE